MDILQQACEFLAPTNPGVEAVTTSANAAVLINASGTAVRGTEKFVSYISDVAFYVKFGDSTVATPVPATNAAEGANTATCFRIPADTLVSFTLKPGQTHHRLIGSASGQVRYYISSR